MPASRPVVLSDSPVVQNAIMNGGVNNNPDPPPPRRSDRLQPAPVPREVRRLQPWGWVNKGNAQLFASALAALHSNSEPSSYE